MQTLGLSSKPQPTDNIFKRLLWPSIESLYDVDLIGQQGFWLCSGIGIMSAGLMIILGNPLLGLFIFLVYFFAGCGVRQRSIAAAAIVFTLYLANFLLGILFSAMGNPVLQIVALMLLLSNIRGTVLAHGWIHAPESPEESETPDRALVTPLDRFSNQLPAVLWPKIRHVFFVFAGVLLLFTAIGAASTARSMHQQKQLMQIEQDDSSTKSINVH